MIDEQHNYSEESYESMWRKPNAKEVKLVSRQVHIDADYHKSLIKIATIALVFFSVVSIVVFFFLGGINNENESWFATASIFIVVCSVYLVFILPKFIIKPRWTDSGRFVVTDTYVISKEKHKNRSRSGDTVYSYLIKVKVVASNRGGDNDYRTYRVDSFDYNYASVGSPGIIVRYDVKLDGRPFMWMDHYLTRET